MRRTIEAIERIGPTIVQAVARPPASTPAVTSPIESSGGLRTLNMPVRTSAPPPHRAGNQKKTMGSLPRIAIVDSTSPRTLARYDPAG